MRGTEAGPPPPGLRLLRDEAARWAEELPARWERLGRPFERRLLDEAVRALEELGPTQGEVRVLHQDLHGGNVLESDRGWLAMDPKPLVGEGDFDVASLLRDRRPIVERHVVARRLDLLVADLDLDRARARGWGVAHALAWGVSETTWSPDQVDAARLIASC